MKIWKKWSKTAAMLMVAGACMFTGMSTTAFANVDEAAVAEAEQQAAQAEQSEQQTAQPETTPPETETKPETEGEKDKPFSVPGNGEVLDQITDGSSKEFYTIRTANNQTFYLVIDHAQNTDNVYMLSTIDENDLQEFTTGEGMTEKPEEKPPVIMEEPQTPTPEPEVQKPEETEKPQRPVPRRARFREILCRKTGACERVPRHPRPDYRSRPHGRIFPANPAAGRSGD